MGSARIGSNLWGQVRNTDRQLTYATDGQQAGCIVGWRALRKEGFQYVGAERKRHNGLRAGTHNHALDPETYKCHEGTKSLHDVCVIRSRFGYHGTQFGVAVGAHLKGNIQIDEK